MKQIFYSWQSDSNQKGNRFLIENILKKEISKISKSEEIVFDLRLDSDTKGISGTPEISTTIIDKIDKCSIFVCDITIINPSSKYRKTCNPNVLFELGYAVSKIGWDNIICIFNSHYAKIEELPFDIRGRRHIQYEYNPNQDKSTQSNNLNRLRGNLGANLNSIINKNDVSGVKVSFPYDRTISDSKVFLVQNVNSEKRKILEDRNQHIYETLGPILIVSNKSNKAISNFKVKFTVSGDFERIGNEHSWSTFLSLDYTSELEIIDQNTLIYTPSQDMLVPGDEIKIKSFGICPIKEKGLQEINIKWQILSENCFDYGNLRMVVENNLVEFSELEEHPEMTNDIFNLIRK